MLIDKKITWTVASKTERSDGKVVLQLTANAPEGVEFSSPSEGIFVTVPVGECILNVGQTVEDLAVAQYDDGVPEEPEG